MRWLYRDRKKRNNDADGKTFETKPGPVHSYGHKGSSISLDLVTFSCRFSNDDFTSEFDDV